MPTDVFWIPSMTFGDHRLAISARPRGGDWLNDEVTAWRRANIDTVVSLLTPEESRELDLDAEATSCRLAGIEFMAVPVSDRGLPTSPTEFRRSASKVHERIKNGGRVVVHCRQGIGRATMMATAVLAESGVDASAALVAIERARGRPVPDTDEQRAWLLASLHLAKPGVVEPAWPPIGAGLTRGVT